MIAQCQAIHTIIAQKRFSDTQDTAKSMWITVRSPRFGEHALKTLVTDAERLDDEISASACWLGYSLR